MIRRLTIVLLFISMFAVACSGGGAGEDRAAQPDAAAQPEATAWKDASVLAEPGAPTDSPPEPAANSDAPPDPPASSADPAPGTGGAALLSALNPLQLLGGGVGLGMSVDVDPQLTSALLTVDDLPPTFVPMGEFSFSMPSEVGDIALAATMFAEDGFLEGELGLMVLSAGISLPEEALAEMGSLSELAGFNDADLAELEAMSQELGVDFAALTLLDASSLGSEAFGMHMEIDFSGFFDVFGAAGGDEALSAGIAMDIYGFLRGEIVLMVMVMWPIDSSSSVDALDLAETMAARAGA